eukprot:g1941.t1
MSNDDDTKTMDVEFDRVGRSRGDARNPDYEGDKKKMKRDSDRDVARQRPGAIAQREWINKMWESHTSLSNANVGDIWYVISTKWIDSWREYVRWKKREGAPPIDMKLEETAAEEEKDALPRRRRLSRLDSFGLEPESINNTHLEDPQCPGALSVHVSEMNDFILVDTMLWSQFEKWYGCAGPKFPRIVREQGVGSRAQKVLELRPPQLALLLVRMNDGKCVFEKIRHRIQVSIHCCFDQLRNIAMTHVRGIKGETFFEKSTEHRLWYDFTSSFSESIDVDDITSRASLKRFGPKSRTETLAELGVMESKEPLIVLEVKVEDGEWPLKSFAKSESKVPQTECDNEHPPIPTMNDAQWRRSLRTGSRADFYTTEDKKWREAIVVSSNEDEDAIVVHCRGWLEGSKYYRISTTRSSPHVAQPHSHVRRWREQLRKNATIEFHGSHIRSNDGAPCYRSIGCNPPFYFHYVRDVRKQDSLGEWWIGKTLLKAHGHFYMVTSCHDPLKLGSGPLDSRDTPSDIVALWKYWDHYEWRRDYDVHVEEVSEKEVARLCKTDIEDTDDNDDNGDDDDHDVNELSNTKSGDMDVDDNDDEKTKYPKYIRMVGHKYCQKEASKYVFERISSSMHNDWVSAKVDKVDFGRGKMNIRYGFSQSNYWNGILLKDLDLDSELICVGGTHIAVVDESASPYAGDLEAGESIHPRGLVGLKNLGNTCYMNSMLQCIAHCDPLVKFTLEPGKLKSGVNLSNVLGTGGEVAEAFWQLITACWSAKASIIAPRHFKRVFGNFNSKFAGTTQQDAMEMFNALMDNLHEDLNRITDKPSTEPVEDEGRPDAVVAKEAWERYQKRNSSVIVDQFFGQDKSQLWCPECSKDGKSRRKFDPRLAIQVTLPPVTTKTVNVDLFPRSRDTGRMSCMIRYGVEVPKTNCSGRDIAKALSNISGVSMLSLVVCIVWNHKIYKMLYHPGDDKASCHQFMNGDRIIAYEIRRAVSADSDDGSIGATTVASKDDDVIDSVRAGDPRLLSVYLTSTNTYGDEIRATSVPLVIAYPAGLTNAQLRDFVIDELESVVMPKLAGISREATFYRMNANSREAVWDAVSQRDIPVKFVADDEYVDTSSIPFNGFDIVFPKGEESPVNGTMFKPALHASCKAPGDKPKPSLTLAQCLESTFAKEQLSETDTWFCPDCRNHVRAFKKMGIWSVANTMVLCLKRFTQRMGTYNVLREKNYAAVQIPLTIDMSPYVVGGQSPSDLVYDLFAVSHHMGSIDFGHYIASLKHNGKWYKCDDDGISVEVDEVINPVTAYVLFYRRRGSGGGGKRW